MIIALGQAGYEDLLARELASEGLLAAERGPGWVRAAVERPNAERRMSNVERSTLKSEGDSAGTTQEKVERIDLNALAMERNEAAGPVLPDFAFAHAVLRDPVEVRGESVNALAQQLAEVFMQSLRDERVESAWPCVLAGPAEIVGLGRRITSVEKAFFDLLRKRLSRVAKLAVPGTPRGAGPARGLFVFFPDFGRAWAARDAWLGGQRRMADDEAAPSRSFLKVEEAYGVLGCEPRPGESVCDLGAAPGGWSYSAARRGARVVAVDNGPLKGGALGHPQIEHRAEDAFKFAPSDGEGFDWLFCDLLEDPHQVLAQIVEPWLARRWCRRFVVNLKFGRVDPSALLAELRAPGSPFVAQANRFHVRHLYHDREEFTIVGNL